MGTEMYTPAPQPQSSVVSGHLSRCDLESGKGDHTRFCATKKGIPSCRGEGRGGDRILGSQRPVL